MKTIKLTVCAFFEALKQFKTSIDDGDRAADEEVMEQLELEREVMEQLEYWMEAQ